MIRADIPAQLISGAVKEVGQAADKPSGLFMKYSSAVAPEVKHREAHSYQGRRKQRLGEAVRYECHDLCKMKPDNCFFTPLPC